MQIEGLRFELHDTTLTHRRSTNQLFLPSCLETKKAEYPDNST